MLTLGNLNERLKQRKCYFAQAALVLPIAVGDVTVADSVVPVGFSVVRVPVFAIAISCVIVILVQVAIVTVLVECLGPSMY